MNENENENGKTNRNRYKNEDIHSSKRQAYLLIPCTLESVLSAFNTVPFLTTLSAIITEPLRESFREYSKYAKLLILSASMKMRSKGG
jgi:hypothetical protein